MRQTASDSLARACARPIAIPGRNCWRIARAARAAFLIDAAAYYAAFAQAVEHAQRSIFILAWDIHSRTPLRPDQPPGPYPDELGPFLDAVVRERRDLRVYILNWDCNIVYAFERELLAPLQFGWKTHRRIQFCLDSHYPVGASLHQKIVVIDDAIAFSGGIDLTIRRWDTPEHLAQHPARVDPCGVPYPPFHDIQLLVDGPAAHALAALARDRWFRRTGQRLPPTCVETDPWPCAVQPDITDVDVAIARTESAYAGRPAVREVEALFLDSIAAAQHTIYMESQYLTSRRIADALGDRLREAHGPEVLLVGPAECPNWLEQRTVGALRNQFVRRLHARDPYGRLRVVYPVRHGVTPCPVFIHSKICIIDATFARVGSANLTNRSLAVDAECDLAIEAGGHPRIAAVIARFQNRLLGEHLGVAVARVEEARTGGSLLAAVDALQTAERGLACVKVRRRHEAESLIPAAPLFDPEGPVDPTALITQALPREAMQQSHRPMVRLALGLGLLVVLGGLWRWTPIHAWIAPTHLTAWAHTVAAWPLAPLMVGAAIALGSLLMLPLPLLVPQAAFLFGPGLGFLIAFTGALGSAVGAFLLGRAIGRDALQRLATPLLGRLGRQLARRGVFAVVAIRLLPVAPFTIVNMVLGAARIKLWHFVVGTAIGLLPGFLALSLLGDRLSQALRRPDVRNVLLLALMAAGLSLGGAWLVRRVQRRMSRSAEGEDHHAS